MTGKHFSDYKVPTDFSLFLNFWFDPDVFILSQLWKAFSKSYGDKCMKAQFDVFVSHTR